MSASVVANSTRLTIISSTLRVDLAVPMQLSVAELLTIVVSSLGRETADLGATEGGWILQRAGEAPLDPATSLAACGVRDGDVLHLRTRATHLPEVAFDDVLDAVATGVLTRTARWAPEYTLRAAATLAGALLVFALVVLLAIGPDWVPSLAGAAATSVLLLLTAVAIARVYRRRVPALAAGGFAVAFAAVAGATGVGDDHALADFGAPQVLVGVSAAALAATVLLAVIGAGVAGLVAVITVALLTAIGTTIATVTTLSGAATAAVVATAALAISPFLPMLSFRLSRLPLPSIPQDAGDLRRDTGTVDSGQILSQAVRADQFLTGLVAGTAVAIAGAAVLVADEGVSERVLAVVLGLVLLLRARLFSGRAQRVALLATGAIALLAVLVTATADAHGTVRVLAFVAPAVVVALALFGCAVTLPGRRYSPPLSRTADIVESLLVLSVIPLALAVMGVYGAARGLPTP
ncbi:type VII secretion integral membrane protein EccD [Jatrophihabitans endophyticus]|uniref:Type VII secretion integral membrane protein EccD n=1 Tax=Jatrophihabitans endophyticus TaxID=1206085 RepID=A0A1M5LXL6_9ACTN|nr:type VII secretion integral membrane protein EccD [Jatrophihabitans endophyticus]SHG69778.1 type VII secretion integral membrane protein EccD [Jatrophihabitans endophyticus]